MSFPTELLSRLPGLALLGALGALGALGVLPGVAPAAAPGGSGEPSRPAGPAPAADPVGEWPLRPRPEVLAGFDPPADPWGPGHRGVDLLGAPGQRVHAALPGRVSFAGRVAGRGVVVVDHGATRTTYEPVTADASVGDQVPAGAVLGALDLVGSHCFPRACLHWGWVRGETYLDPLRLVGAGPVRLLPLWRDTPVAPRPGPPVALPYAGWRPAIAGGWS